MMMCKVTHIMRKDRADHRASCGMYRVSLPIVHVYLISLRLLSTELVKTRVKAIIVATQLSIVRAAINHRIFSTLR